MKSRNEIKSLLEKYKNLGDHTLANGTHLIGRIPHVGDEAYLHTIFPALTERDIQKIENKIRNEIPESLKDFYLCSNGLHLFAGSLSIYGLRDSQNLTEEGRMSQPFDITMPNIDERPEGIDQNIIFIGFYDWDGSKLYMRADSSEIFRATRGSTESLNSWENLDECLLQEIKRLTLLFNKDGTLIDEDIPTTP